MHQRAECPTISVRDTSNRACPSSLAGTTCRRDRSRISPSALRSTIRCRTDRSGRFRRHVTHPHPARLSATVPIYSRPATESRIPPPTLPHHAANLSPEPFPGFPIGDKRHFHYSPCQPPTAPKTTFCCRTDGIVEPLGDLADNPLLDLFDALDGVTCHHVRRIHDPGPESLRGGEKITAALVVVPRALRSLAPRRRLSDWQWQTASRS